MDAHHPTIREALEIAADRTDELIEALSVAEKALDLSQALLEKSAHHKSILDAYENTRAAIAKATGGAA